MKVYKIKVNGKAYKVELESIEEAASPKAEAAPVEQPKPAVAPVASSGEGSPVVSPIQGTVVKVLVKVGDKVKKGQAIAIVEAMKLENEVVSSLDGAVVAVIAAKGNNVASGDALIRVRSSHGLRRNYQILLRIHGNCRVFH